MPKYDVFPNPSGDGFLLDVQSDLLNDLNTRVVVPLLPSASAPKPATRLNPAFDINGESVVMVTQFMAAVPVGTSRPLLRISKQRPTRSQQPSIC